MRGIARFLGNEVSKKLQGRNRALQIFLIAPATITAVFVGLVVVTICVIFAVVITQNAGGCGTTVAVGTAGLNTKTAAQFVQYFESQGIDANGSAGIVGNLEQESGLNPKEAGGGLAQWLGSRWTAMVVYVSGRGLDPESAAGQLTYIVYDLRTNYSTLLTELNTAPDPGTAATMFETVYEVCSGVVGYMQVTPGSQCNDHARRQNAVVALSAGGGGSVPVSLTTGGTCVAVGGAGGDPIPGFTPGRDDMGVDACAKTGMPIFAPAASTLVGIIPNWFTDDNSGQPQPLLLFQFTPAIAGTYKGDEYWYVSEQIVPVNATIGTQFPAGAPVAFFAATGTCIEIGWGSPTNGSRTLVPGDAHPAAGELTQEAETFKTFFHIPWVGQSP